MKIVIVNILLLVSLFTFSQSKNGNLLLLKIDYERNLKIDQYESTYIALEIDSSYTIKSSLEKTSLVYFKDFTDNILSECIKNDTINLKKSQKTDTYHHYNNFGLINFDLIEKNSKKMNHLMDLNIKSCLYNQKITISYTLLKCNYCIGQIST